ncbi:MAG: UDP-N-acetylglucosamine--N-acetylmuramyl-(pentapeptide) pyrophosphoryl-undecaprenol N-acetylglucosamine transferase [Candidatus Paceibacterota bacterium]
MRIIFTGGGTGGHFYPIIAIAQAIRKVVRENKLIEPQLYFLAPAPYNAGALYDEGITFKKVYAGKLRLDDKAKNFLDIIPTIIGTIKAIWTVFWIYPDIVFSKGGYGSVPVVFAARILRIPIFIHESDSAPGRANLWASKFATKIAISYSEAGQYFNKEKIAWTGNPIRQEIKMKATEGGYDFLNLSSDFKTILVLGGSQGAKRINDSIIDILPQLLEKYQVIHQTGSKNFEEVRNTSEVSVTDERVLSKYKAFPYLNNVAMRMSAGIADLVITRGGSTLFEVAQWGIPAIVIPITETNGDHQRKNAYAYARAGAGIVIEENNLTPTVLMQEIDRILDTKTISDSMKEGAKNFSKPDSEKAIAEAMLKIILKHED